jgi:hypothetical protein
MQPCIGAARVKLRDFVDRFLVRFREMALHPFKGSQLLALTGVDESA